MSDHESDLERLLADGMERIRTTLDAEGDGLPDGEAESLREIADAVAEEVSDASPDELLAATGFEDTSDDLAPSDLPTLMQDADPDAVLGLRRLLELADLSEEWSGLDAEERLDRLERIEGGELRSDDGGASNPLSALYSAVDSDEGATSGEESEGDEAESGGDGTAGDEVKDGEDEAGSDEDEGTLAEIRSLFDAARQGSEANERTTIAEEAAEAVQEVEEKVEEEEADVGREGGRRRGRGTPRLSTMPSSRPDMGRSTRHSTVPERD